MKTSSSMALANHDARSGWDLNATKMDVWRGAWSATADINVLHPRTAQGTNYLRGFASDTIAGTRFACGSQMVSHTRKHVENTSGIISVQRVHAGCTAVEFPNTAYVHRPGFITISDYVHEFRASHQDTVNEGVFIPRHRLGLSEMQPIDPIMVSVDSTYGKMLAREIESFFHEMECFGEFESSDLELIVSNIVSQDRLPISDRDEWWRGRKTLIRKYIETHLEDPNLGPLQICHLFNMSRATLYRMFEPDGGVRRYIQDRRLHSAMWDLEKRGTERGRLSRVAERWGFSSDANFNRAAKTAFGMPPGAFFKRRVTMPPANMARVASEHPVYHWLRGNAACEPVG